MVNPRREKKPQTRTSHPTQGVLQTEPLAVLFRARDALVDEVHAIDAVGDVGVQRLLGLELLVMGALDHIVIRRGVDVGECLQEGLWMAGREACRFAGQSAETRPPAAV